VYKKIILITLISLFLQACSSSETTPLENEIETNGRFIDDWTYDVTPKPSDNFSIGQFRLWIPNNNTPLKAILVLSHSYNSNGLGLAHSTVWQQYATNNNLALLSVRLVGDYTDAHSGSGMALISALNTIADKHGLNEIKSLPFLLRGYSAGGVFSYTFSSLMPNRVIAFANIRGGNLPETSNNNVSIPALMLVGELETWRIDRIKQIVLSKRSQGGLWSYAIEPNQNHYGNLTFSDEIIRIFFTKTLSKRIGDNSLNTILESTGWLGKHASIEAFPFNDYPDNKNVASWLIDSEFATMWKNFQ